jgi:uncharacterized membrane protein YtjA (UPF0391 family)
VTCDRTARTKYGCGGTLPTSTRLEYKLRSTAPLDRTASAGARCANQMPPTVACELLRERRLPGSERLRVATKQGDLLEEQTMLWYSIVFLIIALIAGAFGFFGVAGAAVSIAKILFFVFLVLFVISLLVGRRGPTI